MLTVLLLIAGVILLLAVLSVLGNLNKYLKALTALTEAKTENVEADTEVILNPPDNDVDPDEDPDYNPYEEDDHEGLGEDTVIDPLPLLKLVALFRAARQAREAAQAQAQSQVEVGVDADGCFIHATSEPEPEPTPNPETVEVPAKWEIVEPWREAFGVTGTTGPVEEPTEQTEASAAVPDATGDSTPTADSGNPVG